MSDDRPDGGQYDFCVFIGRFRPFHNAHHRIIEIALTRSKYVHVIVGSCFQPRTERSPFSFNEVKEMIRGSFDPRFHDRILISAVRDAPYSNLQWQEDVQSAMSRVIDDTGPWENKPKIALIGHAKDEKGNHFFLDMFPQWESIGVESLHDNLSATNMRDALYASKRWSPESAKSVPLGTNATIRDLLRGGDLSHLFREVDYNQNYRRAFEKAADMVEKELGFRPTVVHNTVDAMVVQSGHVLLIERKNIPGQGLLALPGGFLENREWHEDAFIRELREETKIDVNNSRLKGGMVGQMNANYPYRSDRGRVVSQVFLIKLEDGPLPKVKGRSDAKVARWVPIADIKSEMMFEDHFAIIETLKAMLKTPKK
jgi:bifunctional NMN adenylyltransferase/nudix hydrolase